MTGSFVLVGTQFVTPESGLTIKLLSIPVFFLAGALATALAVTVGARHDSPLQGVTGDRGGGALAWVMGLECASLSALTAVLLLVEAPTIDAPGVEAAALLGLAAMGVQSAMVRLLMNGVASTNVMTTNTTQLAIDCTLVLLEARHRGFVLGTGCGAGAFAIAHFATLLVPVGICYALLAWMLSASRRLAS